MCTMLSCTQVLLLEYGREGGGGINTSGECNGGEWEASGEACNEEEIRTATNTSPRGGEKHKKTHTMMEEGEEEEEMFWFPKAKVEEQRYALGKLTQSLAQLSEWLAAFKVQEVERLKIERECLALKRRQLVREDKRVEMERAQLEIEQQQVKDMWRLGMLVWAPFIQGSLTGLTWRELEVAKVTEVKKGVEADDEDGMADMEGEDD